MLDEKICKLREELNNSIINGQDYSITYKTSLVNTYQKNFFH